MNKLRKCADCPADVQTVCREDVRVCANKRGEVYKITWRH